MKQIIAILMMCCFFGINDSHAQLGKLKDKINAKKKQIGKQIERKLDRKVDQKIEEKVDETFKKKERTTEGEGEEGNTSDDAGGMTMPSFGKTETLTDVYEFDTEVKWKAVMTEKNGREQEEMVYWQLFEESGNIIGMEMGHEGHEVITVMDIEKQISISIINDQNRAIITEMPKEIGETTEDDEFQNRDVSFSKTGRKERIAGYMSEEYVWKDLDEGVEGTVWFTQEIGINGKNAVGLFNQSERMKLPGGIEVKGFIMRITGEGKEGETFHAEVQEYKKKNKRIDMKNYEAMRMNSKFMEKMMRQGQRN